MHKKPIYSFEDKDDIGVFQLPIYSLLAIERPDGMPNLNDNEGNPPPGPILLIVLAKNGVSVNSDLETFIADRSNWMWFYNADSMDKFVKIVGDTMTGALNVPGGATGTEVPQIQEVVQRSGDTMTGSLGMGHNTIYHLAIQTSDDHAVPANGYATPTLGGTIKARRDGNILYMSTNGSNP